MIEKVASSNPGWSGGRIFFSSHLCVLTLIRYPLFGIRSTPVLAQWHVKDPVHYLEGYCSILQKCFDCIIKVHVEGKAALPHIFVSREQEVKELLQNNLLKKYRRLIEQEEKAEHEGGTPAIIEFSLLVIFCVEVKLLLQYSRTARWLYCCQFM